MTFDRRSGLGCSELPAIFGASPYKTPRQIWHEKMGTTARASRYTAAGHVYERPVIVWYAERHPTYRLDTSRADAHAEPLWHRDGLLYGHPDVIVEPGNGRRWVVEVKFFAVSGRRGLTPAIEWQALGLMAVADVDACQVLICHGIDTDGREIHRLDVDAHLIERDRAAEEWALAQAREWWQRHVVEGVPPPVTGEDAADLKRQHPQPGSECPLPEGPVAALAAARAAKRAAEQEIKQHEAHVLDAMGTSEVGQAGAYTVYRRVVQRAGYTVEPTEYVTLTVRERK